MGAGRCLALFGLALAVAGPGCSGGYPLPPTRCDEFCDATKGGFCRDYYGPASCVAECEDSGIDVEGCRAPFDAAVHCFRTSPNALDQRCSWDDQPDDCENELNLLHQCVNERYGIEGNQ